MIETKDKSTKSKEYISEKEKEEIFDEFFEIFVASKSRKKAREKKVLIDKINILTKGKEIIIDNIAF